MRLRTSVARAMSAVGLCTALSACPAFNTRPIEDMRTEEYRYKSVVLDKSLAGVLTAIESHNWKCNTATTMRVEPTKKKSARLWHAIPGHRGEATIFVIDLEEAPEGTATRFESYAYDDGLFEGRKLVDRYLSIIAQPDVCRK